MVPARTLTWRCASVLALLVLALPRVAAGQSAVVLTVERSEATMVITNRGLASEGARNLLNREGCEEETVVSYFYGPPDRVEMVIDNETTLRSAMVIIREPQEEEGEEDQQTIEMLDGEALFSGRPACLESFTQAEESLVLLEQGRTEITATRFFLDRQTDVAQLDGPVDLERAPEEGSDPLHATAESMSFDLETERSTLVGNVRVESGGRLSEADELELDEEAGLATLTGSPARSQEGEDLIAGTTLLYYLDSNDVIVIGGVTGTLEVDLE